VHLLSKEELIAAADEMTDGNIKGRTLEQIRRLMTVTQFVTDLCLNEIEKRGELTYAPDGAGGLLPIVPYECDHAVETVLTRRE
jgi:hypothetical protein